MPTAKVNFDISELVGRIYEAHSYAADQKGLRFTFSISHKIPRKLRGDLDAIRSALTVITRMAIEDSRTGTVELNVDLHYLRSSDLIVKFSVTESSKLIPYWFSVVLESAESERGNLRKVSG